MEQYANLGGDSDIVGYELAEGSVHVHFRGGAIYLYTNDSAGSANISTMHELARAGRGLNGFINRHVRHGYASKLQ